MGNNPKSLPLLLYRHRAYFPDSLTHKSVVYKAIIDLMRPILDSGFTIESFSNLIKEL